MQTLTATFVYSFDREQFFEEKIDFSSADFSLRSDLSKDIINQFLFHIHIALGISYYKFFPTQTCVVLTGKIDEKQQNFWKKFYLNGLGEFFYTNDFDPKDVANFVSESEKSIEKSYFSSQEKYLVPVGGGKDSIVSIELLREMGKSFDLVTFSVRDNELYQNTQDIAGVNRLFVKRLFQDYSYLIQEGYYNGHVPITGMIAFVLQLASYLYDYSYVVLSNEKSADFGNIFWKGLHVNHQYSKSYEFEEDFSNYVIQYMNENISYFSFLRPFYEIQIAKMFAKYGKEYFSKFSSCNTNFKIFKEKYEKKHNGYWCLECPKCTFVYSILRPFLTKNEALEIFGKELFEDEKLQTLFEELLGISGIKPFECVGTNEEVVFALSLCNKKWEGEKPFILQMFEEKVSKNMTQEEFNILEKKLFTGDFSSHTLPGELKNYLQKINYEMK